MNENKTVKKFCFSTAQAWWTGIGLTFAIALSVFITYVSVAPPRDFSIADARYYDYSVVFYNVKCMATDSKLDEKGILAKLYTLGIPRERAVEIFTEARLDLKNDTDKKSTIDRCRDETFQYYEMALNLLKNLD